jgi:hypothetical protein
MRTAWHGYLKKSQKRMRKNETITYRDVEQAGASVSTSWHDELLSLSRKRVSAVDWDGLKDSTSQCNVNEGVRNE